MIEEFRKNLIGINSTRISIEELHAFLIVSIRNSWEI
jgi:hypothetical protein